MNTHTLFEVSFELTLITGPASVYSVVSQLKKKWKQGIMNSNFSIMVIAAVCM